MSTVMSVSEPSKQVQDLRRKRGCLFRIGRGLMVLVIGLVALVLLGVVYQAAAVELDRSNYAPRGQLYAVNGHRTHLVCLGEGGSTVILQAGGARGVG